MSLAERLKTGAPVKFRGQRCGVWTILDGLPPKEADALRGMLADRLWAVSDLIEALTEEGLNPPGRNVFERHRRGDCSCGGES